MTARFSGPLDEAISRATVLVVEDDAPLRILLEQEIGDLGYGEARSCCDADEAMELIKAKAPQVVVTDLRMPGLDGVSLTKWIKHHQPETEVILITAHATVRTASEALRIGASDYLVKPFDSMVELAESLERALERIGDRERMQAKATAVGALAAVCGELVDRLPVGVLLVDDRGKVSHSNTAARSILDERDGLWLEAEGSLGWSSSDVRAAFFEGLNGLRSGDVDVSIAVRRSGARPPLTLLLMSSSESPAVKLCMLYDPEQRWHVDEGTLRELYDLTRAEASVAALMMQGQKIDDMAKMLGVKAPTVRSHLKKVFAKTGTGRQGELVSLLLASPALLRRAPVER